MDVSFLVDVGEAFDDVRQDADDDIDVQLAKAEDEILHVQAARNVFHDQKDVVFRRDNVIA